MSASPGTEPSKIGLVARKKGFGEHLTPERQKRMEREIPLAWDRPEKLRERNFKID